MGNCQLYSLLKSDESLNLVLVASPRSDPQGRIVVNGYTVSFIILYENLSFELPNFIIVYINCIRGFVEHPINIPFIFMFLFILGGVCMGITLGVKALKTFESWHALIAQRMNIKMMKKT